MNFVLICVFAMHSMVVLALPFASQSLEFEENQGTTQNNSTDLEREIDSFEIQNEHKRNEDSRKPDVVTQQKPSSHTIGFENDQFTTGLMLGLSTVLLLCFTVIMAAKMMQKLKADVLEFYSFYLQIYLAPLKFKKTQIGAKELVDL